MANTTPADIIKTFFKTYSPDNEIPSNVESKLADITTNNNPALLNDISDAIQAFIKSDEFKENFANQKKCFMKLVNRKSNTEKAIYTDYNIGKNKLSITATNVMFKSGVKMPYEYKGGIPRYQTITFSRADRSEIEGGDYVPKKAETPEKQEIENDIMKKKIDKIEVGTALFAMALDICAMEIEKIDKIMLEKIGKDDKNAINLIKQAKKKFNGTVPVHGFQQKTAEDKENNKEIKLKYSINRVRIPIDQKTGKVGYQTKTEFIYPISDARKMARQKNLKKPIPAKVKVNGNLVDLNYKNSKSFLRYKSLSNLVVQFEGCLSTFGKSANPKIQKAFVSTHKTKVDEVPFKMDAMDDLDDGNDVSDIDMSENESDNDSASESDTDNTKNKKQKKKSKKTSDDEDSEPESEPEDNSDSDSDSDSDSKKKKNSKKKDKSKDKSKKEKEKEKEKSKKDKKDKKEKEKKKKSNNDSDADSDTDLFNDNDVEKEESNENEKEKEKEKEDVEEKPVEQSESKEETQSDTAEKEKESTKKAKKGKGKK